MSSVKNWENRPIMYDDGDVQEYMGKIEDERNQAIKERDELQRELDVEDEQMVMQIIILREELEVAMKELDKLKK
jgi:hypothetical protein